MSLLTELTIELDNLFWTKQDHQYKRRKSLDIAKEGCKEQPRYYFIVGKIRDWSKRAYNNHTANVRESIASKKKKHKKIIELATNYIKEYDPDFKYTSIQFSKCMRTPIHKDKNNVGQSIIIGLGNYTGGTLDVYNDKREMNSIDIHNKPYRFNGSATFHKTGDFEGMRYTITYFNIKPFPKTEHKDINMNYIKMDIAELTKERDALKAELDELKIQLQTDNDEFTRLVEELEDLEEVKEPIVCGSVDLYVKMSIKELLGVCKEKHIKGVSKMKKQDIINAITKDTSASSKEEIICL